MTEIRIHHGHLRGAEVGLLGMADRLARMADSLAHASETIREQVGNMSEPVDTDLVVGLVNQAREDVRPITTISAAVYSYSRILTAQSVEQRPDDLDPDLPCSRCGNRNTFGIDEDGPTATCTECGWQLSAPSWAMLTRLIRMRVWRDDE